MIAGEGEFWAAVRAELARTRRTQGWLAAAVDVSPNTMSKWMNGRADVPVSALGAIADALDLTLILSVRTPAGWPPHPTEARHCSGCIGETNGPDDHTPADCAYRPRADHL
jgi:transcriptional regulator with XRE-family HTH domain